MRKFISLLLSVVIILSFTGKDALAADPIRVFVDDVMVQFPDQAPFINSDNRTMVPARFVSEALGAAVEWNEETRQVIVKHKNRNILLTIGVRVAWVDSRQVSLDTAPSILGGRTMVPLRFVSECLGAEVVWDGDYQVVYIYTENSDRALVDSDLALATPPPWDNPNKIDLQLNILYKWNTPVEPQLADLKELLEKRFGNKAQEIIDYIAVKKDVRTRIIDKEWVINGKHISVTDYSTSVSVSVWG